MIRLGALVALVALGGCSLGGCSSTNATNLDNFITTLSKTNCHVQGTLSAQIGAMNPGSGANLTTSIDCPNGGGSTSTTQVVVKPTS